MNKYLLTVAALAMVAGSASALEVDFGGFIKTKYTVVDNERSDADSIGAFSCTAPIVLGGTDFCDDSEGFSQDAEFDVKVRGATEMFPEYGGDFTFNTDASIDESEIYAITSFGRFGVGTKKVANLSADRISVGESGVSTDPLGREYHDQFGGVSVSYAIAFGGFSGGFNVTEKGELGATVLYEDETDSGLGYQVFARASSRDEVFTDAVPGVATVTAYETVQYGGKLTWGDLTLAASMGEESGDDYAGAGFGDISREYENIAVAYKAGKFAVSADYDRGTVTAPWTVAPPGHPVANSAGGLVPNSDRKWESWSIGAAYTIAPGLTFGVGHKMFDNLVVLNLDSATNGTTSGLTLKNQNETAASIKLAF